MRYKPSRRLHVFFLLSTLGHVAFFVWGLPWLATLPQGRPHATPVRIAVATLDTASRAMPSDVDAKPAPPQPAIRPAAAPSPPPTPTPEEVTKVRPPPPPPPKVAEEVTKVRPSPPPPPKVAKVKPPTAQPSPSQHRKRSVRPRRRKVHKRPTPRPTVQKRQSVAPPPSSSSPPLQPVASSASAVAEAPMKAQQLPALPAGAAVAKRTELPASTSGKPAAVASSPPPQGWVPRFAYKPCPRYPYVARRRRVEGTVTLRFAVLPVGTIGDIQVVKSSGNASLDNAAQKAVRKWRPLPDKGLGSDNTWVHVPFTFALTAQNGRNGHDAPGVPAGRVAINCDAAGKP